MAQQRVIDIEVGNAVKSLSDLRKEINELKSQLYETKEGTEEYEKTLQTLGYAQQELDSFMLKSSKNASALEGSYNAL